MLRRLGVLFHCLFLVGALWRPTSGAFAVEANDTCLWYAQPAKDWNEALPIGNGRMGAMVFGGIADERIQFNEDTLWTGRPHDYVRAGAREQLAGNPAAALAEGKTKDAALLARKIPERSGPAEGLSALRRSAPAFPGHENATDYRRELDLDSAIASTTYRVGDVTYRREVFASYPDQAIVVRLTADQSRQHQLHAPDGQPAYGLADTRSCARHARADRPGGTDGLRFESRVRVVSDGGTRRPRRDNSLSVENANSATLLLVAATSFKNFQDISADPAKRCAARISPQSAQKSIDTILADHLADHRRLFRRVTSNLGRTAARRSADRRAPAPAQDGDGLESDPGARGALFSIRPLPADRQQPPRRPAGQPAGRLERGTQPAVGEQVHDQHQFRDELLAGGVCQPQRMPRAAVRHDR